MKLLLFIVLALVLVLSNVQYGLADAETDGVVSANDEYDEISTNDNDYQEVTESDNKEDKEPSSTEVKAEIEENEDPSQKDENEEKDSVKEQDPPKEKQQDPPKEKPLLRTTQPPKPKSKPVTIKETVTKPQPTIHQNTFLSWDSSLIYEFLDPLGSTEAADSPEYPVPPLVIYQAGKTSPDYDPKKTTSSVS